MPSLAYDSPDCLADFPRKLGIVNERSSPINLLVIISKSVLVFFLTILNVYSPDNILWNTQSRKLEGNFEIIYLVQLLSFFFFSSFLFPSLSLSLPFFSPSLLPF